MRELTDGTQKHTKVIAEDEAEFGANHKYVVMPTKSKEGSDCFKGMVVNFQKGPIKENGVNGLHNEDLLIMVLDRLRGFQTTDYACDDNAQAIEKIQEALLWLRKRTTERQIRGVEGTSEK